VPVRNGARWLPRPAVALAQDAGVPIEVVMVEDGSGDGSAESWRALSRRCAGEDRAGDGQRCAAALNAGIQHARYPLIAQVDQDVVSEPGWLAALILHLGDMTVAAAQGYYETDPEAPLSARVMSLDLRATLRTDRGR
jgi:glycosyltransferase involved in cell wall biosynthesis